MRRVSKRLVRLFPPMSSLPYSFLPFPPSSLISYRVFQCKSEFAPYPIRPLELARRRIVRHWAPDAPILSVVLSIVDVSQRSFWIFAVGEQSDAYAFMQAASFDGLEGEWFLTTVSPHLLQC